MFKFIHCADLHIDSPLRGLSQRSDAPVDEIRLATRRAFDNLVELAIRESVDFVVIAGDVFDGDWPDYSTGIFFNTRVADLGRAGIRVVMASGNHDAESQLSRHLTVPDNVTQFPTRQADTVVFPELGVAIHGQGFWEREVRDNLVPGYPAPVPGLYNVGVLHCSVDGSEGHDTYAPCKLDDLIFKGYDYWALGHIHKRDILHPSHPFIAYSGNLQGRHIRETGAKGALLVSVSDDGETTVEFRPLDVLRWALISLNLAEVDQFDDVLGEASEAIDTVLLSHPDVPLAIRLELIGATAMHGAMMADVEHYREELRNIASMRAPGRIWVESIKFRTTPPEQVPLRLDDAVVSGIAETLRHVGEDRTLIQEFLRDAQKLQRHLGMEFAHRPDVTSTASEADARALLQDATALLMQRLFEGGPR